MIKVPSSPLTKADYSYLRKGTELHRVHLSKYNYANFNPCQGGDTRFAPIQDQVGQCIPSLYTGATARAAFHESVFHDVPSTATLKTVRLQDISQRTHSQIKTLRRLKLVQLRNVSLSGWGISRRDLIESNAKLYKQTAVWAQAIHHSFPDAHGLVWTSRQCDPEQTIYSLQRYDEREKDEESP